MTETSSNGLRLLSLDGGGIRGLSALYILERLLQEVQVKENNANIPLPCEYFDLIGGTSTGGIIALMLGRLRMSVSDAIKAYGELSKEVFSERKRYGDGKYKASKLERQIKKVIAATLNGKQCENKMCGDEMMRDHGETICKTFVCASDPNVFNSPTATLFRTYQSRSGTQAANCMIWQAARATAAALSFFKAITIDDGRGVSNRYTDGGTGANNPTKLVLDEAEWEFPGRNISCIISIGTGRPGAVSLKPPNIFYRVFPRIDVAIMVGKLITDCEKTAEELQNRFKLYPDVYFRLNVNWGMEKVNLGDWEKLDVVKSLTTTYLNGQETRQKIGRAAQAGKTEGSISIAHACAL